MTSTRATATATTGRVTPISYDSSRFNPKPSADYLCPICHCVLYEPRMCPCQHIFCRECIETWLARSSTCPTCRNHTMLRQMLPAPPLVQSVLNSLTMDCEHKEKGCASLVPMELFPSHLKNCDYRPAKCPNDECLAEMTVRDLVQHKESCQYRVEKCTQVCNLELPYYKLENHDCVTLLKDKVRDLTKKVQDQQIGMGWMRRKLNNLCSLPHQSAVQRIYREMLDYMNQFWPVDKDSEATSSVGEGEAAGASKSVNGGAPSTDQGQATLGSSSAEASRPSGVGQMNQYTRMLDALDAALHSDPFYSPSDSEGDNEPEMNAAFQSFRLRPNLLRRRHHAENSMHPRQLSTVPPTPPSLPHPLLPPFPLWSSTSEDPNAAQNYDHYISYQPGYSDRLQRSHYWSPVSRSLAAPRSNDSAIVTHHPVQRLPFFSPRRERSRSPSDSGAPDSSRRQSRNPSRRLSDGYRSHSPYNTPSTYRERSPSYGDRSRSPTPLIHSGDDYGSEDRNNDNGHYGPQDYHSSQDGFSSNHHGTHSPYQRDENALYSTASGDEDNLDDFESTADSDRSHDNDWRDRSESERQDYNAENYSEDDDGAGSYSNSPTWTPSSYSRENSVDNAGDPSTQQGSFSDAATDISSDNWHSTPNSWRTDTSDQAQGYGQSPHQGRSHDDHSSDERERGAANSLSDDEEGLDHQERSASPSHEGDGSHDERSPLHHDATGQDTMESGDAHDEGHGSDHDPDVGNSDNDLPSSPDSSHSHRSWKIRERSENPVYVLDSSGDDVGEAAWQPENAAATDHEASRGRWERDSESTSLDYVDSPESSPHKEQSPRPDSGHHSQAGGSGASQDRADKEQESGDTDNDVRRKNKTGKGRKGKGKAKKRKKRDSESESMGNNDSDSDVCFKRKRAVSNFQQDLFSDENDEAAQAQDLPSETDGGDGAVLPGNSGAASSSDHNEPSSSSLPSTSKRSGKKGAKVSGKKAGYSSRKRKRSDKQHSAKSHSSKRCKTIGDKTKTWRHDKDRQQPHDEQRDRGSGSEQAGSTRHRGVDRLQSGLRDSHSHARSDRDDDIHNKHGERHVEERRDAAERDQPVRAGRGRIMHVEIAPWQVSERSQDSTGQNETVGTGRGRVESRTATSVPGQTERQLESNHICRGRGIMRIDGSMAPPAQDSGHIHEGSGHGAQLPAPHRRVMCVDGTRAPRGWHSNVETDSRGCHTAETDTRGDRRVTIEDVLVRPSALQLLDIYTAYNDDETDSTWTPSSGESESEFEPRS